VRERDVRSDQQVARRHLLGMAVRIVAYAIALFVLYALAPLGHRKNGFIAVELVLSLVALGIVVAWQVRAIVRSPYPRLQAMQAVAISVPLLIVAFAGTYVELAQASPESFTEPIDRIDGVYFTVTVLATVGFGDIAPVSATARLVVTVQMVADLTLVGFIAKVVLNAVQDRRRALAGSGRGTGVDPGGTSAKPEVIPRG
jgi:voltage-gated potassium channel